MQESILLAPNGQPINGSEPSPEFRAASDVLLDRLRWAKSVGLSFNNARDMYNVLGYDRVLTYKQFREYYDRGGIGARVVDVFPNATWRGSFEIVEDEDPETETDFEKAWLELDERLQVQAKLLRVDKLSLLSTFAILLIGASGSLDTELPRGKKSDEIFTLTPFAGGGSGSLSTSSLSFTAGDADATIAEFEKNPGSPRFGLPKSYTLKRVDVQSAALAKPVHWSRVLHIADGLLDNEVFGPPALERVWNLLQDLDKVTGGGAEAFWLRANQGLHLDIDKDMAQADVAGTIAALKEQSENYKHQLTRWLRTRGVKAETLGSDVAAIMDPADAIITQIAGAKGIPKRILTGSEMGELASSQDRENWKDQINGRQTQYAGPYIIRPLIDRLIEYGYLPAPADGKRAYKVQWPHTQVLTEQEKVDGAKGWATVNSTQGSIVYTDEEIRDKWSGMAPLTDEQKQAIVDAKAEAEAQKAKAAEEARAGRIEEANAKPTPVLKAAAEDHEELVRVLAEAIDTQAYEVVDAIVRRLGSTPRVRALGDNPGHEFHGNQWTSGTQSAETKAAVKSIRDELKGERGLHSSDFGHIYAKPEGFEIDVRNFGSWQVPPDEQDDGDYDWKIPTPATTKMFDKFTADIEKRHPKVAVRWENQGEKNWISFHVTDKGKKRALGDNPGHEFHGNQYGDAKAEKKLAKMAERAIFNVTAEKPFRKNVSGPTEHEEVMQAIEKELLDPDSERGLVRTVNKHDYRAYESNIRKYEVSYHGAGLIPYEQQRGTAAGSSYVQVTVSRKRTLGDNPGHEFHGNQWTEGRAFNSTKDADAWGATTQQWAATMTDDEHRAIGYYTNAVGLNDALRKGRVLDKEKIHGSMTDVEKYGARMSEEDALRGLDSLFAKPETALPENIVVHRAWAGTGKPTAKNVGATFTDKGFTSTAASHDEVNEFFDDPNSGKRHSGVVDVTIRIPKGTKALYLGTKPEGRKWVAASSEVLLNRNTKYRVVATNKTPTAKATHMTVEVVQ